MVVLGLLLLSNAKGHLGASTCWHMPDRATRPFLANAELQTTPDRLGEVVDDPREYS